MVGAPALPVLVAFDAEVVVGLSAQFALSNAFEQALRQGDARGNAVLEHLAHGLVLPLLDVGALVFCTSQGCQGGRKPEGGPGVTARGRHVRDMPSKNANGMGSVCRPCVFHPQGAVQFTADMLRTSTTAPSVLKKVHSPKESRRRVGPRCGAGRWGARCGTVLFYARHVVHLAPGFPLSR